jgi:23S rRNA (cytosine1962-C5)-methyltransferase
MSPSAKAILKPGREKSLLRRHPWVFSGAIARVQGRPSSGETVEVVSAGGEFLAHASYSPASQIRLRAWTFDAAETVDESFFRKRLQQALEARRLLGLLEKGAACRVVFGESDGLPGLVVDRYGEFLVCQFLGAGAELWRRTIVEILAQLLGPAGIYERSESAGRRKEGLESKQGLLAGRAPPAAMQVERHGVILPVNVEHGQKTGAYLDQQENRTRIASYACGARVLDAFSYSGGFGIACLKRGAVEATLVETSGGALALAAEAARLNGVEQGCRRHKGDVFGVLRRLCEEGEKFDLLILDPPKFAHSAAQVSAASRAYKDINRLGLQLLRRGGLLGTFSCSGHVEPALFQKIVAGAAVDAGRRAQIVESFGQPADHPVALSFPESAYLKGLLLRVQ